MIYTVILKSLYPEGKLDYGSVIWRKEGVRQKKKMDYSIKILLPYVRLRKLQWHIIESINNLVFKRGG